MRWELQADIKRMNSNWKQLEKRAWSVAYAFPHGVTEVNKQYSV